MGSLGDSHTPHAWRCMFEFRNVQARQVHDCRWGLGWLHTLQVGLCMYELSNVQIGQDQHCCRQLLYCS